MANLNAVDCIVTASTSRLWRDIYPHALILKAVRDAKKEICVVDEPTFTVYADDDPNQFLMNGMMGVLASWVRLVIAQRLKRGRQKRAKKGLKACGETSLGYRWTSKLDGRKVEKIVVPHPEEVETVKEIFRACVRTETIAALQRFLEALEIRPRSGKPFSW